MPICVDILGLAVIQLVCLKLKYGRNIIMLLYLFLSHHLVYHFFFLKTVHDMNVPACLLHIKCCHSIDIPVWLSKYCSVIIALRLMLTILQRKPICYGRQSGLKIQLTTKPVQEVSHRLPHCNTEMVDQPEISAKTVNLLLALCVLHIVKWCKYRIAFDIDI